MKKLVQRQWARRDWRGVGQGWDACEDTLRLTGWSQRRRVTVMRRVRKIDLVVGAKRCGRGKGKDQAQAELHFIDENEPVKSWEYAVLVCNGRAGLRHIQETAPQLGKAQRWYALVRCIAQRILASQPKPNPLPPALQSG